MFQTPKLKFSVVSPIKEIAFIPQFEHFSKKFKLRERWGQPKKCGENTISDINNKWNFCLL